MLPRAASAVLLLVAFPLCSADAPPSALELFPSASNLIDAAEARPPPRSPAAPPPRRPPPAAAGGERGTPSPRHAKKKNHGWQPRKRRRRRRIPRFGSLGAASAPAARRSTAGRRRRRPRLPGARRPARQLRRRLRRAVRRSRAAGPSAGAALEARPLPAERPSDRAWAKMPLDGFRAEFRAPEGEIGREFHPREALGELYLSRGVPGVVLFSTPSKKRPPKRPRFLERRGLCTPKVCPSVHNKTPRSNTNGE